MVSKESDDNIKKITHYLEKGGTMLANHHECGAPMFRYQGKILCPVCDFEEKKPQININKTVETEVQQIDKQHRKNEISDTQVNIVRSDELSAINTMITNKVQELAVSLQMETDLGRVRDKMDCIELGIKIMKLLQE